MTGGDRILSLEEKLKKNSRTNRFFRKKRMISCYVAVVGLIGGVGLWYQLAVPELERVMMQEDDEAQTVDSKVQEVMEWPVQAESSAKPIRAFYKKEASTKEQEACLVRKGNTYFAHDGLDFSRKDGKTFDVVAALTGEVEKVGPDQVVLKHADGIRTYYQCVSKPLVKAGEVISQGDVIACAGCSELEKADGVHLHFCVKKNEQSVDPATYLGKKS
ncbi:MAG: hypothetical protein RLZ12_1066 [Bacillota bacterium]|jgi:stage II sporulation protein Q